MDAPPPPSESLTNNEVISSLWSPSAVEKCRIGLADVLIYEAGVPVRYYVTGATGDVKLKRNFDMKVISKRWITIAEQLECNYVAVIRQEGDIVKYLNLDAWQSFVADMKPDPAIRSIHTFLSSSHNVVYRNSYQCNVSTGRWRTNTSTYSVPRSDSIQITYENHLTLTESRAAPINKVVDLATTTVVRYIERMLKITLTEFSVDYIIDKKSQIWMLWSTMARFNHDSHFTGEKMTSPRSPQTPALDMDTTARTITDDDEMAAGLSNTFYEMTKGRSRQSDVSKQLNTMVATTSFASLHDRPSSPNASAVTKFPQPFNCRGDYCNLDVTTTGALTLEKHTAAQHIAQKLFTEDEIQKLRKDARFNKMMEFNSAGVGLAEITMRSISLARKENRGSGNNNNALSPSKDGSSGRVHAWKETKDGGQSASFLGRMSSPKKYNDFLEDENLIANPSLHYEQVRVCGVCYNVYRCLDWARNLLAKEAETVKTAATTNKRRPRPTSPSFQLQQSQSASTLIPQQSSSVLEPSSSPEHMHSSTYSGRVGSRQGDARKNQTMGGRHSKATWKSQVEQTGTDRKDLRSKLAPLESYIRGESSNILTSSTASPPRGGRSVSPSNKATAGGAGGKGKSSRRGGKGSSPARGSMSSIRSSHGNYSSFLSTNDNGEAPVETTYRGVILLACGEGDEVATMQRMLEDNLFRVQIARDGREAANELLARWDNIDCVIVDRDLPLGDAFALAQTLRGYEKSLRLERAHKPLTTAESGKFLHHRMPIVCYTHATSPADLTRYMRADMDGCLSRPLDTVALLNTIRAAVPHHLAEVRALDEPMAQPKTSGKVFKMGLLGELEGSVDSASAALKTLSIASNTDGSSSLNPAGAGAEFQGVVQLDADTKIPFLVMNGAKFSRIRQGMARDHRHQFFNLVVCHDIFDTFERMKILLQPIVQRYQAIQVLVWNYPGQAHSEWRSTQVLNNEYMAACLNDLLGQIGESGTKDFATDQPFYVMGYGYGANIAAYYLANYRVPNVRGLLSVNGWSYVDSYLAGVMHDCVNIFQNTPESRPDLPVYFFSRFLFSKDYLAKVSVPLALNIYTAVYNAISLQGRLQLCAGILRSTDIRPLLKTLDCPLICLHSNQDSFTRPLHVEPYVSKRNGEVRSINQALQYPSTTCVIWLHGGHEVFQENRKQIVLLLEQVLTGYHEVHEITFPSAAAVHLDTKYSMKQQFQAPTASSLEQSLEDKFTHSVLSTARKTGTASTTARPSTNNNNNNNNNSNTNNNILHNSMNMSVMSSHGSPPTTANGGKRVTIAPGTSGGEQGHTTSTGNKHMHTAVSLENSWSSYSDVLLEKQHSILTLDTSTTKHKTSSGTKKDDPSVSVGYMADVKDYPEVQEYMHWRLKRNKKRLQRLQLAAQTIQTAFRAHLARHFVKNIRRIKAARMIQRIFRGFLGRRSFFKHVKRLWASITIQTCWRGYNARRWYFLVRVKIAAAADIQRMFRGHLGRLRVQRIRRQQNQAAAVIQAMFRRFKARREVWLKRRLRNCSITIQRIFRGFLGRKRANNERDKYIFSKSQSQGIEFGRQMLLEHKLHVTRLQSDVTLLTQEKVAAEEHIEALLEEIATFEEGVRSLEKEMHQLSKVESEAAAFMDEDSKFELREQKMRLDREFGEMLAKIGHRKELLTDLEKKLSAIDKARQGKEEDLRTLERKLVVLLEDQQKELQAIRRKQDVRGAMLAASHDELARVSTANHNPSRGSTAGNGGGGGGSGPSLHEKRQAAQLMQSTETLMKFGFMSMSMTYFSSLNMIKALRTVSAQDTVMAALADVHAQRAVGMDQQQPPSAAGGVGGALPSTAGSGSGGVGSAGGSGGRGGYMPQLKTGQLPGQQSSLQVSTWSVDDVAKWLQTLSLGQYAESFIDAAVDGEFLYDLNDEDLKNTLGIEHRLHRKKILNCIARLKMAEVANDARLTRVTNLQNNATNAGGVGGSGAGGDMGGEFQPNSMAFPDSAMGPDEDRNINGPKVPLPELFSLVRHSKFAKIKDAIDYLPNKSFDKSLVQAQYVPEHGTVYLSSYERLPFHANKTDEHGNTMLSLAAQNGNAKIVKYLLAKGANPNHQNHQGQTAAHFAIAYQFFDLSTWLFENGADDTLENKYGLSAYDGLSNEGAGEDDGGGGNALVEYN